MAFLEPGAAFDVVGTRRAYPSRVPHLSDEEILEFTYITAMYEMHATMSRALRTEFDDRAEPIVEVIGPEGVSALDVGRSISLPMED